MVLGLPQLRIPEKRLRLAFLLLGVALVVTSIYYLNWLFRVPNQGVTLWFLIPYYAGQVAMVLLALLSWFNNRNPLYDATVHPLPAVLPHVAVIVPTCGEPVAITEATLESIVRLRYPAEKMTVVLSTDDRTPETVAALEQITNRIQAEHPEHRLIYNITREHRESKAGNMNQVLDLLKSLNVPYELVLTQDADEIAEPEFLERTVGYFAQHTKLAAVQTIKRVRELDVDDLFDNHCDLFYLRMMAAKNGVGAAFACGSGVIWNRQALDEIGGFATWNITEDMTTSYELIARGWRVAYHYEAISHGVALQDIPNVIKQKGVWALDTFRMFLYDNPLFKKGLTFKQKFAFFEVAWIYLTSIVVWVFMLALLPSLYWGVSYLNTDIWDYLIHLIPFYVALECYMFIHANGAPYLRSRQYFIGLGPVYLKALLMAIWYGPSKNKPTYKVTRKTKLEGLHIGAVWSQTLIMLVLVGGVIVALRREPIFWGDIVWAGYYGFFLQGMVWAGIVSWERAHPMERFRWWLKSTIYTLLRWIRKPLPLTFGIVFVGITVLLFGALTLTTHPLAVPPVNPKSTIEAPLAEYVVPTEPASTMGTQPIADTIREPQAPVAQEFAPSIARTPTDETPLTSDALTALAQTQTTTFAQAHHIDADGAQALQRAIQVALVSNPRAITTDDVSQAALAVNRMASDIWYHQFAAGPFLPQRDIDAITHARVSAAAQARKLTSTQTLALTNSVSTYVGMRTYRFSGLNALQVQALIDQMISDVLASINHI